MVPRNSTFSPPPLSPLAGHVLAAAFFLFKDTPFRLKRDEHPNVRGVSIRSRNDPSQQACMSGQWSNVPPPLGGEAGGGSLGTFMGLLVSEPFRGRLNFPF